MSNLKPRSARQLSTTAQRAKALGARRPSVQDTLRAAPDDVRVEAAQAADKADAPQHDPRTYIPEWDDLFVPLDEIDDQGYANIIEALKFVDVPWEESKLKNLNVMSLNVAALGNLIAAVREFAVADEQAWQDYRMAGDPSTHRNESFGRAAKAALLFAVMLGK